MVKWFKSMHIYTQFSIICCITLVLMLSYMGFSFKKAEETAKNAYMEYENNLVSQVEETLALNHNLYSKIMRLISYDKDVQSFLLAKKETERIDAYSTLKRTLIEVATLSDGIYDIVIEDREGNTYGLADFQVEIPKLSLLNNVPSVSNLMHRKLSNSSIAYLVMGKNIASIDSYDQTNQTIGKVYLVLTPSALIENQKKEMHPSVGVVLTDKNNQLLFSNTDKVTAPTLQRFIEEKDARLHKKTDALFSFPIYSFSLFDTNKLLVKENNWIQIWAFNTIIVLVFLWFIYLKNLTKPLNKLRKYIVNMDNIAKDLPKKRLTLSGYKEAEVIANEFNSLLDKSTALTKALLEAQTRAYESSLLLKQSELAHLRSQVNPHFLYNTLETMVGIAYTNNQKELAEIARSLSLIFKFSIKGDSSVPLKTEWKIAQNYVRIQHYRFEKRFDVQMTLDKDLEMLMVPKLVLQPVIENAIIHGIEQSESHCTLTVCAKAVNNVLHLYVTDDGEGMDEHTLRDIQNSLQDNDRLTKSHMQTKHIGILNVDSRIKLQYSNDYGIHIESQKGKGTKVEITLPLESKKIEETLLNKQEGET